MASQPLIGSGGASDEKIFEAFCCGYVSVDLSEIALCMRSEAEQLCCTHGCCLEMNTKPYPIGLVTPDAFSLIGKDGHCIAVGLPCCFMGLKVPSTLCNGGQHFLCLKSRVQCPCGEAIPGCMCAICFLQCVPDCKCFASPAVPFSFNK